MFICDLSHRVNDVVVDVGCSHRKVVKQLHQFSSSKFAVVTFDADALAVDLQADFGTLVKMVSRHCCLG